MRKTTFKFMTGLFLCAGLLVSCSADTEETAQLTALEKELQLENKGLLQIENSSFIFKQGETSRFVDGKLDYSFKYTTDLDFVIQERTARHPGEDILVKNAASEEYVIFSHIAEVKNGFSFNLEFSNGLTIDNVSYFPSATTENKWHDVWIFEPESDLMGALIESANSAMNANCRAALNVCNRWGGKAVVNIHSAALWFSTAAACNVQCVG